MRMRYLTIPAAVMAIDPSTDAERGPVTFADACRVAMVGVAQRASLEVLSLIGMRRKLVAASEGDVVELRKEEWTSLCDEFTKGKSFSPAYLFAAERHVRAVLDATTTKPEPVIAPDRTATAS